MAKKKFNRSKFLTNRWKTARESQAFFEQQTGEKRHVREFLSNEKSPIRDVIMKIEVSYDLSIRKEDYNFFIEQKVFEVFISKSQMVNVNKVDNSIRESIADIFQGRAKPFVFDNLNIDINKIQNLRGMEEVKELNIDDVDFKDLSKREVSFSKREQVVVGKQSGKQPPNKNRYNLEIFF